MGLYEHVTGCGDACSLGRRSRADEREPEPWTQARETPHFREGRRQERSSVLA